jgi:hypothetical protein
VSDTQARLDARDALQRAIRHTRKRFSAGTPEKYPGTPLYGLRLSEAEALAAELERVTAALRETEDDALSLLDQHISTEVRQETGLRIIERIQARDDALARAAREDK